MVICDFHLFDPVLVEAVTEMNPLLIFVGSLLAENGGIHQEYIFTPVKSVSDGVKRLDNILWRISCRNGTAFKKRFLHAVSETSEIPSAQAAAASMRKEKSEQAYKNSIFNRSCAERMPLFLWTAPVCAARSSSCFGRCGRIFYPIYLNVLAEVDSFW